MSQSRRRKLAVLAGLVAAVVLLPLVALAVSDPSTVESGTTFDADDGPELIVGESATLDTSVPFPDGETVSLGAVSLSGDPEATGTVVGFGDDATASSVAVAGSGELELARDDTAPSVAAVDGDIEELSLFAGAEVGDGGADIGVETAGPATVEVRGLAADAVSAVSTASGDVVASSNVVDGTATLSLDGEIDELLALSTALPSVESVDGPETARAGDTVSVEAEIDHPDPDEEIAVAFHRALSGDPDSDPLLGTDTVEPGETATTEFDIDTGPEFTWYVHAVDTGGAERFSDIQSITVEGGTVGVDVEPNREDILTDGVVAPPNDPDGTPTIELDIELDFSAAQFGELTAAVIDADEQTQAAATFSEPGTQSVTFDATAESQASIIVEVTDEDGEVVAQSLPHNYYIPRIEIRDLVENEAIDIEAADPELTVSELNGPVLADGVALDSAAFWLPDVLSDPERGERTYEIEIEFQNDTYQDETYVSDDWRAFPSQLVYVRDDDALDDERQVTFELVDRTGEYEPGDTILRLSQEINGSYQVVETGIFGANSRVTRGLEAGEVYRVSIENETADNVREFGRFVPEIEGEFVELEVGEVDLLPGEPPERVVATDAAFDDDEGHIQWSLTWDPDRATAAETDVRIYHPDNESIEIFSETVFGVTNRTVTVPLTADQAEEDWVIEWDIEYQDIESGETITETREQYLGGLSDLDIPVSSTFLSVVAVLSLLLLMGLFGGALATIGAVVTVGAAWLLYSIGVFVVPVEFLAGATVIAVLLRLGDINI